MKIKFIISFALLTAVGIGAASAQRGSVTIFTQPTSDGELIDVTWDNSADRVNDGEEVARITGSFSEEKAAVLEFPLPPSGQGNVRKANLVLFSNEKGLSPITVQAFAYWGENADGVVSLDDWGAGKYLGDILVAGESEISVLNRWPAFDVTEAVRMAIKDGASTIGFFLRASEESRKVPRGLLRVRTAEFGIKFEQYKPKLELYFE